MKLPRLFVLSVLFLTMSVLHQRAQSQNFWEKTNGPPGGSVASLAINSSGQIFVGTSFPTASFPGGRIFYSTDNGTTWIQSYLSAGGVLALAVNTTGTILAGVGYSYPAPYSVALRSTDSGASWSFANTGLDNDAVRSLAVNSNGEIFAGNYTSGAVFRSTNDGANWTLVYRLNYLNGGGVTALAINASGTIFAGTYGCNDIECGGEIPAGIIRSTDNGRSWVPDNTGLTDFDVSSLVVNSSGHIFAGTSSGVFRSTNNGDSWTHPLATSNVSALAINASGQVFAGTQGGGVFRSMDNGATWTQLTSGLSNLNVSLLAVNAGGRLFAGTPDGIFRSVQSTTSVTEFAGVIPIAFSLEQNYPNPFNPNTTIEFSLPQAGHVTLKVFNLLGKEVATLASGGLGAGRFRAQWNATSAASGIYIYKLQAGSFIQTRTMLLLR